MYIVMFLNGLLLGGLLVIAILSLLGGMRSRPK